MILLEPFNEINSLKHIGDVINSSLLHLQILHCYIEIQLLVFGTFQKADELLRQLHKAILLAAFLVLAQILRAHWYAFRCRSCSTLQYSRSIFAHQRFLIGCVGFDSGPWFCHGWLELLYIIICFFISRKYERLIVSRSSCHLRWAVECICTYWWVLIKVVNIHHLPRASRLRYPKCLRVTQLIVFHLGSFCTIEQISFRLIIFALRVESFIIYLPHCSRSSSVFITRHCVLQIVWIKPW